MKINSFFRRFFIYFLVLSCSQFVFGYVGSTSCGECHEEIYQRFIDKSLKFGTLKRVRIMQKKLTEDEASECYICHTTGYQKGGFTSEGATPDLAHVGCESCHGAGDAHCESEDPEDIVRTPALSVCEQCHSHSEDKVFVKNALMYSGAH